MRSRSLARWLVVGALAVFSVVLFSGLALAQDAGDTSAVQGQNGAAATAAVSGPAAGVNGAVLTAGPAAAGIGSSSQSQQFGDNSVTAHQSSTAKSGDAVAGSQVNGVVGGGHNVVQNSNSSLGAVALSGPAVVSNVAVANAGPRANSLGILGNAQSGQVGDNHMIVHQESEAISGDAVAGSQVTGIVGGDAIVANQNSSLGSLAVSGGACAAFVCGGGNILFAGAGPDALAVGLITPNANAAQFGDNDVVIRQATSAVSGDALAGAQVTGAVGADDMVVANSNSSRFSFGFSGPAVASNIGLANAGPGATTIGLLGNTSQVSQGGDNRLVLDQSSGARSGDAVAGSQVTGLVSSEIGNITVQNQQSSDFDFAISGAAIAFNAMPVSAGPNAIAIGLLGTRAQASQIGDNVVVASQHLDVASGDALAGAQVTGVVAGPGADVVVQNQGRALLPIAVSAPAIGVNVAPVNVGPSAVAIGLIALTGSSASQFGDNELVYGQDARVHSGDAVAGSQVTGVVSDGRGAVTVQNSNYAVVPISVSGLAVGIQVGAQNVGPNAIALSPIGLADARVSQFGSNLAAVDQRLVTGSGDAVAGSQVTGVVGGREDVVVANMNASILPIALTGPAIGFNFSLASAGPAARAFSLLLPSSASASQFGDNVLLLTQDLVAESGDGVAGSQITGVVAESDPIIGNQNFSLFSLGRTGFVAGGNAGLGNVGSFAATPVGFASSQQTGTSALDGAQALDLGSGDGVSGSQVTGAVTNNTTHGLRDAGRGFSLPDGAVASL